MSLSHNGTLEYPNTSKNVSNNSPTWHFESMVSPPLKAAIASIYVIILVVGVTGNSLVVYTFGWRRRHKKLTNEFLLMCLGICDLSCSIIFPVLMITYIFTHHSTTSYITGCLIHPPLMIASVSISQVILVLICYDRYRAISKPLARKLCITFAKYGTFIGSLVSLAISIPMFLHFDSNNEHKYVCFRFKESFSILVTQASLLVARDLTVLIIMAWLINKMLRTLACSEWFRRNSNSPAVSDFKRTRKLLLAVVGLFTICIFPTDLYCLIVAIKYRNVPSSDIDWDAMAVQMGSIVIVQVLNSVVNVFIYSAVHREFQIVLKEILGGVIHRARLTFSSSAASTKQSTQSCTIDDMANICIIHNGSTMTIRSEIAMNTEPRPHAS